MMGKMKKIILLAIAVVVNPFFRFNGEFYSHTGIITGIAYRF